MLNSDSPRPCRTRRADFFESPFEEARIDRLRTGWLTFGERRSIKGRVGNCGRVFSWIHAFSIELNYCFNGIRIGAQRKMRLGICHLMLYAVASRRPLFCSPAGLFVLMRGAIIICLCCLAMSVLSHVLLKR